MSDETVEAQLRKIWQALENLQTEMKKFKSLSIYRPSPKQSTSQVNIRMPILLKMELENQAAAKNMTLTDYIRDCLAKMIEESI